MVEKSKRDQVFNTKIKLTCKCGYKIVLIPDVHIMSKTIEDHVSEHISKDSLDEKEADGLRWFLISQTLIFAGESRNNREKSI